MCVKLKTATKIRRISAGNTFITKSVNHAPQMSVQRQSEQLFAFCGD